MKTFLQIPFLLLVLQCFSQESHTKYPGLQSPCSLILDSLNQINYFRKAKQIDTNYIPIKVALTFYLDNGCLVSNHEYWELFYSDSEGYFISSNSRNGDHFFKFTSKEFLQSLIIKMNNTYVFDRTFLIVNPRGYHSTAEGKGRIDFVFSYPNGELIKNQVSFDDITNYCIYLNEFYCYLESYNKNCQEKMTIETAYYFATTYKSVIAQQFIQSIDNLPLKIIPKSIESIEIENQKVKIDTIKKKNN